MNTHQLQLVSFEQAKRLKKLGFDWNPEYMYDYYLNEPRIITIDDFYNPEYVISAPSVALALKWMRDKKGFSYSIVKDKLPLEYSIHLLNGTHGRFHIEGYEAAENYLLDELLTILEKEYEK
jgi:hypothetical protein